MNFLKGNGIDKNIFQLITHKKQKPLPQIYQTQLFLEIKFLKTPRSMTRRLLKIFALPSEKISDNNVGIKAI